MPDPARRAVVLYFVLLAGVGLAIFRDYGVPWDEPKQRMIGGVSVRHILQTVAPARPLPAALPDVELADLDDRDYGVVFEAPAVAVELLLGLTDTRAIYMARHLLTYFVFLGGVFAVYRLAVRRFDDWRLGLFAATLLVLSPRLFAEAFYNTKDVVFMAMFAIATNTMLGFVMRPAMTTALLHAVATAAAIDLRIVAIVLVPMTAGLMCWRALASALPYRRVVALLGLFVTAAAVLMVLMFPWLWADPIGRFMDVWRNMSSFQRFTVPVRYMGDSIRPDDLPWHYLPVWIGISTPLVQLALFFGGAAAILRMVVTQHVRLCAAGAAEMQDLVFLALLCGPLISVVALDGLVYDGWRHVYFVYPAFLLIAIRGWVAIALALRPPAARKLLVAAVVLLLAPTVAWMVRVHPMQNVYFNVLAGDDWRRYYEVDYWGLGNRAALEYVLAHDAAPMVTIKAESTTPLDVAALILRRADRRRLEVVDRNLPARYILTNYRGEPDVDAAAREPGRELFYQLTISGEVVVSVFRTTF